jgi:hypothetical protein
MKTFEVLPKFQNNFVTCNAFSAILSEATQEQLEHLFHLGHKGIVVKQGKKVKDKIVDNFAE